MKIFHFIQNKVDIANQIYDNQMCGNIQHFDDLILKKHVITIFSQKKVLNW